MTDGIIMAILATLYLLWIVGSVLVWLWYVEREENEHRS